MFYVPIQNNIMCKAKITLPYLMFAVAGKCIVEDKGCMTGEV